MIQPNELRLGNHVTIGDGKTYEVTSIDFTDGVTISTQLTEDEQEICNATWDEIYPINLTEQHLKDFGFEKNGTWCEIGVFAYSLEQKRCSWEKNRHEYSELPFYKYAHQIQNLYFSLHQEEL